MTPADVAERSGVSRTTIYRWWPTPTDLLREALAFHSRRLDSPDTGSWPGDVHALLSQVAAFLSDPIERAQNSIMASGLYPAFSEVSLDFYQPLVAAWRHIVERGIDRGEVSRDVAPQVVLALMLSPLLAITLIERRSPTAEEIREFGKLVVRATANPPHDLRELRTRSTRRARDPGTSGSRSP